MTVREEILKALKTTIEYCKRHDILKEFLETKEREVVEIMMSVFTQEQATNMVLNEKYNEGKLESKLEGRSEGKLEGIYSIAKSPRDSGTAMETIIKCTGVTEEQIMKL